MSLASLFVDTGPVTTDLVGLAAVALVGRHEPDGAVAVVVVVPVHECRHPQASLFLTAEGTSGIVRPVFHRAEQGFGVGVVVADPGSGEGPEHAQLLQPHLEGGGPHGVAVVGMEDQRLAAPPADPLPQAGPADKISGDLGILVIGHVPSHRLSAPDVDHQVEVEPHAPHARGQVGDIPAPELIRPSGLQSRHQAGLLGRPGAAAAVGLTMGMEHPVETALRADVDAPIRQGRHDLSGRQSGEFRLVAGKKDSLALLVREAVRNQTVAAFTAIQSVPITRELTPPTLESGEPHAKQSGEFMGPCTGRHAGIEDLQSPPAINWRGQSPPSSPQ